MAGPEIPDFNFGDDTVAGTYDRGLVPVLFRPWAERLVESHGPWDGKHVLDLATGTGIVAEQLASRVGPLGKVIAADINPEMLSFARRRCTGASWPVEFLECSADSISLTDSSIDHVVCQQGFQFFPDKPAAAREIFRILKEGGMLAATTWCPVEECLFFGLICSALEEIGEPDISDLMRVPFDYMPDSELRSYFENAGFTQVVTERYELDMVMHGGIDHAVEIAYATPIKPHLTALAEHKRIRFRKVFSELLGAYTDRGIVTSCMVSTLLSARKQG